MISRQIGISIVLLETRTRQLGFSKKSGSTISRSKHSEKLIMVFIYLTHDSNLSPSVSQICSDVVEVQTNNLRQVDNYPRNLR